MASFASVINLPSLQSLYVRLDRNNYSFWRIQMLSTVRAHGLDDLIDKYKIPPSQYLPSPSGDCVANQDFLSWIRRDQFLVSWILSSIGESVLGYVTRCVTAKDIWLVLENLFESTSKVRVMQLQLQLHTQKKGDLTVDAYFLKMREIADQLAVAGKPMADDDLCLQILGGFGAEYDAVVVNLTSRPDELNLQEVQFALQAHEIHIQSQFSFSSSAHVAYNNRSGGRGYPTEFYPSSGGRFSRGRGGGRMVYRDNRITCQLCSTAGHVALKCFKRFDVHFTGVTSSTPQPYITDVGFGDHSQADCYYEHGSTLDPSWYVDSGATNHITHDAHNLSCNVPYHGNEQVAVGNGSQLPINAIGFSDADWASSIDDCRSTGGHCIFFGTNLVTWSSRKQPVVSRSSFESEYRALANATVDIVWLHSLCTELGVSFTSPSQLWSDNKSAIALASNDVFHATTKHVEIDVHFIREKVQAEVVDIGFVPSEDQIADIFTKPLPESSFVQLRKRLRLGG